MTKETCAAKDTSMAKDFTLTPFITKNYSCLMSFLASAAFSGTYLMGKNRKCSCTFIEIPDNEKTHAVEPNWEALAALVADGNTLCAEVDMRKLPLVCAHLQEKGAAAGVSATVFYHKKSPLMQYCSATLHDVAAASRRAGADSTVLLIAGPAACSNAWQNKDTLFTKNIVVAYVEDKQDALLEKLRQKNAFIFELPVSAFLTERANEEYKLEELSKDEIKKENVAGQAFCDCLKDRALDMLILPDAQLSGAVFRLLEAKLEEDESIKDLLEQVKIVACGPIAASVVEQHGLEVAVQPDSYIPSKIVAAIMDDLEEE